MAKFCRNLRNPAQNIDIKVCPAQACKWQALGKSGALCEIGARVILY